MGLAAWETGAGNSSCLTHVAAGRETVPGTSVVLVAESCLSLLRRQLMPSSPLPDPDCCLGGKEGGVAA